MHLQVEWKNCGYGQGYLYPHDFPNHMVDQQYLPDKMKGTIYYKEDETAEKNSNFN